MPAKGLKVKVDFAIAAIGSEDALLKRLEQAGLIFGSIQALKDHIDRPPHLGGLKKNQRKTLRDVTNDIRGTGSTPPQL